MAKARGAAFLVNLIKSSVMNGPSIFFFLLLAVAGFIVFIRISKNDLGIVSLKGNGKKGVDGNNPEIIFNNIYSDKKQDEIFKEDIQEETELKTKESQEEVPEAIVEETSKEME